MVIKIGGFNAVIFLSFIFASFVSVEQTGIFNSHYLTPARAVTPSRTVTVPAQIQPSVLLVIESKDATEFHSATGYRAISEHWFPAIGMGIVQLAIPHNGSGPELVDQLTATFPFAIAASNDRVIPLGTSLPGVGQASSRRFGNNTCFSNERIGMIDGPVNSDHAIFDGHSIVRKSFVANKAASSNSAHGTAVLSVLVDTYAQGSSQPLNISVAEIFEHRKTGIAGSLLSTVKALDWLVSQGVTVINMSFQSNENAVFSKVLDMVAETGTIMVAAVGNKRPGTEINFPAAHPKVLAVTAIDSFQNASPYASRGEYVDFAAPGINVPIATLHGSGRGSGTSYAAPFVTSVVALTLAGGAPRDPDKIRRVIARNATDLGVPGKDDVFGWGLPTVKSNCGQE